MDSRPHAPREAWRKPAGCAAPGRDQRRALCHAARLTRSVRPTIKEAGGSTSLPRLGAPGDAAHGGDVGRISSYSELSSRSPRRARHDDEVVVHLIAREGLAELGDKQAGLQVAGHLLE